MAFTSEKIIEKDVEPDHSKFFMITVELLMLFNTTKRHGTDWENT